jgi:hypothetical protein
MSHSTTPLVFSPRPLHVTWNFALSSCQPHPPPPSVSLLPCTPGLPSARADGPRVCTGTLGSDQSRDTWEPSVTECQVECIARAARAQAQAQAQPPRGDQGRQRGSTLRGGSWLVKPGASARWSTRVNVCTMTPALAAAPSAVPRPPPSCASAPAVSFPLAFQHTPSRLTSHARRKGRRRGGGGKEEACRLRRQDREHQ